MCWMCEQDDLAGAYQGYVARREAASIKTKDPRDNAAPIDEDWAIGTWFAATKLTTNE